MHLSKPNNQKARTPNSKAYDLPKNPQVKASNRYKQPFKG
jgi:hypothetical protein